MSSRRFFALSLCVVLTNDQARRKSGGYYGYCWESFHMIGTRVVYIVVSRWTTYSREAKKLKRGEVG